MPIKTPFYDQLSVEITALGGIVNAHLHLDRAGTMAAQYMDASGVEGDESSAISLAKKHSIISVLHDGDAYDPALLTARVTPYLDTLVECGTRRADTVVDCTDDRVQLSALDAFRGLKAQYKDKLDLNLAAYNPLGFRDDYPGRWALFAKAAEQADFLGSLPERDDKADYPDHIGFSENCRRVLRLAKDLGKPVHVHTDQRNLPSEQATELLIEAVEDFGGLPRTGNEPMIWAIHVISPSTYDEDRFDRMVDGLRRNDIGVICCPSAAISMRQIRHVMTPTYNCIARVLEMLAAGVHVRLGSDNIADMCSPAATPDLRDEIFVLSNALRFFDIGILAKLVAGREVSEADRALIKRHLEADAVEMKRAAKLYGSARSARIKGRLA